LLNLKRDFDVPVIEIGRDKPDEEPMLRFNRICAYCAFFLAVGQLSVVNPTSASSQKAPTAAASPSTARFLDRKQHLIQLMNDMAAASIRGDAAFFDRVLGLEFMATTVNGEVKNKAQILADYRAGTVKFKSHVFDDYSVRFYGNMAIVTNRAKAVQIYKGKERTGQTRNTRVWVLRGMDWQCVSFQSTRIQ